MRVQLLDENIEFPPVEESDESGILAVGGDLSPARLLSAYEQGIFPWYQPGQTILWWAPLERGVLPLESLKIHKSMRNELNRKRYRVTYDTCFKDVIKECSLNLRGEKVYSEDNTWISQEIISAYTELAELGVAHSVEVWEGKELVGGLYGVSIGRMFFGESMFAKSTNASKVALIDLVEKLKKWGFGPIDCQMMNSHIASLGAQPIKRSEFQILLKRHLKAGKTKIGSWANDNIAD